MKFTVSTKLWIGFLSVLLVTFIVGGAGLWALTTLNKEYRLLVDDELYKVALLEQLISNQHEDSNSIRGFILYKDEQYITKREQLVQFFNDTVKELHSLIDNPASIDKLKEVKESALSYKQITELLVLDFEAGNEERILHMAIEAERYQEELILILEDMIAYQKEQQAATETALEEVVQLVRIVIMSLTGASVIISLIVALTISRSVGRPVRRMTRALKRLASGDFLVEEVNIRNRDEIGDMATAFQMMTKDLKQLIGNARQSCLQESK